MQNGKMQNLAPGTRVKCPRCGGEGIVAIDTFTSKGRRYTYLVVRHREGGRLRRCVIGPAGEENAKPTARGAKPRAKPSRGQKPRAKAKPAAKQSTLPVQPPAQHVIEEVVKVAVAEALGAISAEMAKILAAAVAEALKAITAELEAQRVQLQRIEDAVKQRKGPGARAVARGEKKIEIREGNLYWMICKVLQSRAPLSKEEIAEEIARRFGRRVSGNSLSGRLSELAAAGYVVATRSGRRWLWRLTAAATSATTTTLTAASNAVSTPSAPSQSERKEERSERTRSAVRAEGRVQGVATTAASSGTSSSDSSGLPSFVHDNPWLAILSGSASAAEAATTAVAAGGDDLPSFARDNPWLTILSRV